MVAVLLVRTAVVVDVRDFLVNQVPLAFQGGQAFQEFLRDRQVREGSRNYNLLRQLHHLLQKCLVHQNRRHVRIRHYARFCFQMAGS